MSRATILPYPGDPFLINYWLKFYDHVWGKEVDRLYVVFNSTIEKHVANYIVNRISQSKNTKVVYVPSQIEHGSAIDEGLKEVIKDNIEFLMLIEDDAIVFRTGKVNMCFSLLETGQYDIIGSKRESCSAEITSEANKLWKIKKTPYQDSGASFWPCYFFTKTDILNKTSRSFCARAWNKGEKIEPLQHVVEAPVVNGDTFVNTSLELRAIVPEARISYVPQYHLHPDDFKNRDELKNVFDGQAPWLHIGSLSSGVSGVLRDSQNRPLSRRKIDPPGGETKLEPWANTEMEKLEWERRVAFWELFWQKREPNKIAKFATLYKVAIDRIIDQYKLKRKNILRIQNMYLSLGL